MPHAARARVPALLGRHGVPVVAVLLALVLLAAIAVAALRSTTASAATVVHRGEVSAELPDGGTARLGEGDVVPRGAVVAAGRAGAVLRVRDRDTWLSGDAVLSVRDGAVQELREGFVMVDARRGPELELRTPAGTVTTPEGTVSRVERGALLRVGAYSGDPVRVRAENRRATAEVGAAHQVQVPYGGLPGRTTPLVLTAGDAYERALAAELVAADEALVDLAGRLDGDGPSATVVRTAATTDLADLPAAPGGVPGSEQTLAYLLARAADGEDLRSRFAEVRRLRSEGGSWGVVAALVDAEVADVAALLDALLVPAEAVLAAEDVDVAGLLGLVPAPAAPASQDGSPAAAGGAAPAPAPATGQPAPAPGPTPPPPSPLDPLPPPSTEPVDAVVATVLGLLPTTTSDGPITSPSVPSLPGDPAPSGTTSGG